MTHALTACFGARRILEEHGLVGPRSNGVLTTVDLLEHLAMGLSIARVKQLLDEDRLPHLVHRSGARLIRRQQLDVVANARLWRELRQ